MRVQRLAIDSDCCKSWSLLRPGHREFLSLPGIAVHPHPGTDGNDTADTQDGDAHYRSTNPSSIIPVTMSPTNRLSMTMASPKTGFLPSPSADDCSSSLLLKNLEDAKE